MRWQSRCLLNHLGSYRLRTDWVYADAVDKFGADVCWRYSTLRKRVYCFLPGWKYLRRPSHLSKKWLVIAIGLTGKSVLGWIEIIVMAAFFMVIKILMVISVTHQISTVAGHTSFVAWGGPAMNFGSVWARRFLSIVILRLHINEDFGISVRFLLSKV